MLSVEETNTYNKYICQVDLIPPRYQEPTNMSNQMTMPLATLGDT